MTEEQAKALRKEFDAKLVGKLPRRNKRQDGTFYEIQLDYVGHAQVTDRLITVDPAWSWEPMAKTADGLPILDANNGLWINLTVCGVTRPGYGYAQDNANAQWKKPNGDLIKEAIGDALRNAAMRFGVALDLWSKEELESSSDEPEAPKTPEKPSSTVVVDKGYTAVVEPQTVFIHPDQMKELKTVLIEAGFKGDLATRYCVAIIGKEKPTNTREAQQVIDAAKELLAGAESEITSEEG